MHYSLRNKCIAYIALFRPSARSLQWKKVLRLLHELSQIADEPYVQWKNQPARPCSARILGLAIEKLCENPPKRLPLTSHGYLQAIMYELADETDRKKEQAQNSRAAGGSARPSANEPEYMPLNSFLKKQGAKSLNELIKKTTKGMA